VEISVNSKEDINANFLGIRGYLAFVKGQEPLLIVSVLEDATAKQVGDNTVLYHAILSMDATSAATQQKVCFLNRQNIFKLDYHAFLKKWR
jgi:hypothetical protein